jgi:hypothetical protein
MKRLLCFAVLALALIVTAQAQYRPSGPPASVTSSQPNPLTGAPLATPGASVTSGRFSPVFPPTVRVPHRNRRGNGHGRFGTQFTPGWASEPGFVAVPVPVPVDENGNPIAMTDPEAAAQAEEDEAPAYTVFERRSRSAIPITDYSDIRASMRRPREQAAVEAQPEQAVPDQPATVLIFRDGRQLEITNYAIQSGTLFNLSDNGPRKIALADLDVDKTVKANDERGVDFTLPTAR